MRNAAATLGLIAGLIGIVVGFVGYGAASLTQDSPELARLIGVFDNPAFVRFASFAAPLLAIAGGAMARDRALVGGVLLLASAAGFYLAFGYNLGTMFPIGFAGLGGILAIVARQPDTPQAH